MHNKLQKQNELVINKILKNPKTKTFTDTGFQRGVTIETEIITKFWEFQELVK